MQDLVVDKNNFGQHLKPAAFKKKQTKTKHLFSTVLKTAFNKTLILAVGVVFFLFKKTGLNFGKEFFKT